MPAEETHTGQKNYGLVTSAELFSAGVWFTAKVAVHVH